MKNELTLEEGIELAKRGYIIVLNDGEVQEISPQGYLENGCLNRHVHRFYCDGCKEEFNSDELYEYEDKQLCAGCVLSNYSTVG